MKYSLSIFLIFILVSCRSEEKSSSDSKIEESETSSIEQSLVEISPISHATFIIEWGNEVLYVDPTGEAKTFQEHPKPSLVLITDIHGDHFNLKTLEILPDSFDIVAPQAVYNEMPQKFQNRTKVLANEDSFDFHGINFEGIPMYNITEERKKYHPKGRGNGYVLTKDSFSIYVSGDTENIREMKNLKNINIAFLCMNLPYTMSINQAVEATLLIKPQKVIPYHYRGVKDGERHLFDVQEFKKLVDSKNENIKVELLDWYPSS